MPYARKYYLVYPFKVGDRVKMHDRVIHNQPQLKNTTFIVTQAGSAPQFMWYGPGLMKVSYAGTVKTYDKKKKLRFCRLFAQALMLL